MAKTASVESFSNKMDYRCYTMIGSIRDPADIGGFPDKASEKTVDAKGNIREEFYMKICPPEYVMNAIKGSVVGEKWVIFFDELTTCPPAVQAAMLRVIAEGVVGDTKLPENTLMLAAANPPGIAANGFEIEPPMANRLCHLQWEMEWDDWDEGMRSGLVFPSPSFPKLPKNWRNRLPGVGNLFAAFRKHMPTKFEPERDGTGGIKLDRNQLGGAWPSPRSITNACIVRAAAESVNADKGIIAQLVAGCAGQGFEHTLDTWETNLDLPDPEETLAGAALALKKNENVKYKRPNRPDKVLAHLGAVVSCVLANNTDVRWHAAIAIIERAMEFDLEICAMCAKPLVKPDIRPKNAAIPQEFVDRLLPTLMKAAGGK
jgi:hypothetical protein